MGSVLVIKTLQAGVLQKPATEQGLACADHILYWKIRQALKLDSVPMGVAPGPSDNLILDMTDGHSASGFGHPSCKGGQPPEEILKRFNDKIPVGPRR